MSFDKTVVIWVLLLGTVSAATFFTNPEDLTTLFRQGQKLYASSDYPQAIQKYQKILRAESNIMINTEKVIATVGDVSLPVKSAALYQLGNSYRKQGLSKFERSKQLEDQGNKKGAEAKQVEGKQDLLAGSGFFRRVSDDPRAQDNVRVMALYQIVQCEFDAKEYGNAVEAARTLVEEFPASDYEDDAYYTMGWAYYWMGVEVEKTGDKEKAKEYQAQCREALNIVVGRYPSGFRADRSLYQIGESYLKEGEAKKAREYFSRLLEKHDFSLVDTKEETEMKLLKLRGIVKETTRELCAKAQIKIGETYELEHDVENAVAAYRMVKKNFEAEKWLVQQSLMKIAEVYLNRNDTEKAVAAYKNAINLVPDDKEFQAKMQAQAMRIYWDGGKYREAIREYRLYIRAYVDVADRIDFSVDKAQYRVAECFKDIGEELKAKGAEQAAADTFQLATDEYQVVLDKYAKTSILVPNSLFGLAYCQQMIGTPESLSKAFQIYRQVVTDYPENVIAQNALMQIGRVHYFEGEYEESAAAFNELIDSYPESHLRDSAFIELAITYRDYGRDDEAVGAFGGVSLESPQIGKARLEMSKLYIKMGKYEDAERVVQEVMDRIDDPILAGQMQYQLGMAYFASNSFQQAIEKFTIVIDDPTGMEADLIKSCLFGRGLCYSELAEQASQQAEELKTAGDATAAQRESKARDLYLRAEADLEEMLKSGAPNEALKMDAYRRLGVCKVKLFKDAEAVHVYQAVIDNSPDPFERAWFQLLLTELYHDMKRYEESAQSARTLLAMDFEDSRKGRDFYLREKAYFLMGDSFMNLAEALKADPNARKAMFSEAVNTLGEGLKRFADGTLAPDMMFSEGIAYFYQDDFDYAVVTFKKYITQFPKDRNVTNAYYYLAHADQQLGSYVEAGETFAEINSKFPGSQYAEEARFLEGENWYNNRQWDKALAAYRSCRKTWPKGEYAARAMFAEAWTYLELQQIDDMLVAMRELQELYPTDRDGQPNEDAPKAQFTVGDHYYNIKDYLAAAEEYRKVIERYPGSPEAEKAKDLIDELSEINAHLEYQPVFELFSNGKYEEAATGFLEVIKKYPGTDSEVAAYCNLGMSYEYLHKWKEAAEAYNQVLLKYEGAPDQVDATIFARQHRDWIVENRL